MLMLNSKVVFYENMTGVPPIIHLHTHFVWVGTVLHKCDQFADSVGYVPRLTTRDLGATR